MLLAVRPAKVARVYRGNHASSTLQANCWRTSEVKRHSFISRTASSPPNWKRRRSARKWTFAGLPEASISIDTAASGLRDTAAVDGGFFEIKIRLTRVNVVAVRQHRARGAIGSFEFGTSTCQPRDTRWRRSLKRLLRSCRGDWRNFQSRNAVGAASSSPGPAVSGLKIR